MKRPLIIIILAILIPVAFTGCQSSDSCHYLECLF